MDVKSLAFERIDPLDHREVLLDITARNLPISDPEARFDWIHVNNPEGKSVCWVAWEEHGKSPVATCMGLPRLYRRPDGSTCKALVLADVCSEANLRFVLPALLLQKKVRNDVLEGEVDADFSVGCPIDGLAAVQARAGMTSLGGHSRWARPVSLMTLRKMGRDYSLPVAIAADCWLKTKSILSSTGSGQITTLDGRAGEEFDQFDQRPLLATEPIRAARTSQFLNWRVLDHPFHKSEILVSRSNGELNGYLILSDRHPGATTIVDLQAANDSIFRRLLNAAEKRTRQLGRGTLWLHMKKDSPVAHSLENCGFQHRADPVQITMQSNQNTDCNLTGVSLFDCDFDV